MLLVIVPAAGILYSGGNHCEIGEKITHTVFLKLALEGIIVGLMIGWISLFHTIIWKNRSAHIFCNLPFYLHCIPDVQFWG